MRSALELVRPFHHKVKAGAAGRKGLTDSVSAWRSDNPGPLAVIHSASAGEFEAAIPIFEELKKRNIKILATLYSPSGYNLAVNNTLPDGVFYLPFDSRKLVKSFLQALSPDVFVFCKHDIWPNVVWICGELNIPLIIANTNLHRKSSRLNPFLIHFNRGIFNRFDTIFTVSDNHARRIEKIAGSPDKIAAVGDSRFDRVVSQVKNAGVSLPETFTESPALIGGSVWPAEDFVLESYIELHRNYPDWKLIWVPHEPHEDYLVCTERMLLSSTGLTSLRYSGLTDYQDQDVLIVDQVGVLPPLYKYADIAYVGGGFGKGVHSVIEPAAFSIPVIFGPNNHVSAEAGELLKRKCGFAVRGKEDFMPLLVELMNNGAKRQESGNIAGQFVAEKTGAAEIIAQKIAELVNPR